MDFLALDLETADMESTAPCSIGYVLVQDNQVVQTATSLIDPEMDIDEYNTYIHGITNEDVVGAPTFPEIWATIEPLIRQYPIVAHNATFDCRVLRSSLERYSIPAPEVDSYCTMWLFRERYPDADHARLTDACERMGIDLDKHHDSLCDAMACANILLQLLVDPDFTVHPHKHDALGDPFSGRLTERPPWRAPQHQDLRQPDLPYSTEPIQVNGSKIVITGTIPGFPRKAVEARIVELGGSVSGSVSKNTRYLAVGFEDALKVGSGNDWKSSKIRKAEDLIAGGAQLSFVTGEALLESLLATSKEL